MRTISLTGDKDALPNVSYYDEIFIKGSEIITFNISTLNLFNSSVLRAVVDYGDGASETINYNIDINSINITYIIAKYGTYFPKVLFDHRYTHSIGTSSYFINLSASILLQFADFDIKRFIIPIRIARESYYNAIGSASIIATQLVDNGQGEVFCVLQTEAGNVINAVLS